MNLCDIYPLRLSVAVFSHTSDYAGERIHHRPSLCHMSESTELSTENNLPSTNPIDSSRVVVASFLKSNVQVTKRSKGVFYKFEVINPKAKHLLLIAKTNIIKTELKKQRKRYNNMEKISNSLIPNEIQKSSRHFREHRLHFECKDRLGAELMKQCYDKYVDISNDRSLQTEKQILSLIDQIESAIRYVEQLSHRSRQQTSLDSCMLTSLRWMLNEIRPDEKNPKTDPIASNGEHLTDHHLAHLLLSLGKPCTSLGSS